MLLPQKAVLQWLVSLLGMKHATNTLDLNDLGSMDIISCEESSIEFGNSIYVPEKGRREFCLCK